MNDDPNAADPYDETIFRQRLSEIRRVSDERLADISPVDNTNQARNNDSRKMLNDSTNNGIQRSFFDE